MGRSSSQPTQAPTTMPNLGPIINTGPNSGIAVDSFPLPKPAPTTPEPAPAPTPMVQPTGPNVFQQSADYMKQAGETYGGLAGFQAPTAQAAQIGPVGSLATANMQQYMSPYTEQVIQRGEADIARQREQAMNQLGAQATAAGAFGGSRQGVAEGVAMGEYGRMAGDFAARQRQQAFQQAQQAAQYDIGQAQQRALQQASLQQQAAMANQQAALSGAGVQQAGAAGLGGLAGQAFGMGQQAQQAIGRQAALQRSLQQQMIDAQRQQFAGATGAPLAGLGALSQVLGSIPTPQTTTTSQPFNPATLLMLL